uniref:Uncharacterized protein n=1 Tax=Arundo donax TaxID=35708 RepID=A0A0A8YRF1_ARUDO
MYWFLKMQFVPFTIFLMKNQGTTEALFLRR